LIRALLLCLGLACSLLARAAEVGEVAPEVSLPSLTAAEQQITLSELRGRIVYLDFWASWCGPCRLSFPQLEALRQELGPRGFEVLAVGVDEQREDGLAFLEEVPVSYPVVWDGSGDTPRRYEILGMPTGYLIDGEGQVRVVHQGFRRGDGERLREEIIKLLGE